MFECYPLQLFSSYRVIYPSLLVLVFCYDCPFSSHVDSWQIINKKIHTQYTHTQHDIPIRTRAESSTTQPKLDETHRVRANTIQSSIMSKTEHTTHTYIDHTAPRGRRRVGPRDRSGQP